MKQTLKTLLFCIVIGCAPNCFAQVLTDSIWDSHVKTVTLYKNGILLEEPIIPLEGADRLVLTFDLLQDTPPELQYRFQHCDAEWHADEMQPYECFSGFEQASIENHQYSFTTLQPYIHFSQVFPSDFDHFLISGNYILYVFLQDQPDSILLTRRFRVSENAISLNLSLDFPRSGGRFQLDQEVSVELASNPHNQRAAFISLRPEYLKVIVQQNGRCDNIRQLSFSGYSNGSLCYRWKEENIFPGGNTFRYCDLSNLRTPMYNVQRVEQYGGETFVALRPDEDRSRRQYVAEQVLNGGMKVNIFDRNDPQIEADYVWVNFSLPLDRPFLNGSVHIVGALTDWKLNEQSRMIWNPQFKAYTLRLLLKQGYYAYQMLFLTFGETEATTATLEGDHSQTPNRYSAFIYLRQPGDRYDRLIATKSLFFQ